MRRLALALILVVTLLGAGCQGGGGPSSSRTPSSGAGGPGGNRRNLHALPLPVPRTEDLSHADPAHFAAALASEPPRIFEFVRDSIAYEAYPGLLRGPRGTLLAAAGNAVDRSALLAAMLERAGQRVRFARGTLDQGRARILVMSMWAPREEMPIDPPPEPAPEFKAIGEILPTAVRRDFSLIHGQLKSLGIQLRGDAVPSLESLVQEARQHYWVQWSKDGRWIDLDPSFPDAQPGQTYARAEEVFAALPASLLHHVRLRVIVEEYTDSTPSAREILTYSANAAELSGSDLLLIHVPEHWGGPAGSLQDALAAGVSSTGSAKPVLLVGAQHFTGEPFRLTTAAGGIGSVGRLLRGEGSRNKPALAMAEFLEIEFIDPSGHRDTITREIFDAVGPARRAAGQVISSEELQRLNPEDVTKSIYSLFFTTGRVDAGHVLVGSAPAVTSPAGAEPVGLRMLLRRIHIAFAVTSDALAARIGRPDAAVVLFYQDSPRLTILDLTQAGDSLRLRMDLRRDRARAVAIGPRPETAVLARIQRGVVDGTLERVLLAFAHPSAPTGHAGIGVSTSALFEAAQAEQLETLVLPRERSRLAGDVPPDALARLDAEMARGYVAIGPQRALSMNGARRYAWWRIHPASGETTAATDEGLHGSFEAVAHHDRATGEVTTIELYFRGSILEPVLLGTLNSGSFVRLGGLPAVFRLLRTLGYEITHRSLY